MQKPPPPRHKPIHSAPKPPNDKCRDTHSLLFQMATFCWLSTVSRSQNIHSRHLRVNIAGKLVRLIWLFCVCSWRAPRSSSGEQLKDRLQVHIAFFSSCCPTDLSPVDSRCQLVDVQYLTWSAAARRSHRGLTVSRSSLDMRYQGDSGDAAAVCPPA